MTQLDQKWIDLVHERQGLVQEAQLLEEILGLEQEYREKFKVEYRSSLPASFSSQEGRDKATLQAIKVDLVARLRR